MGFKPTSRINGDRWYLKDGRFSPGIWTCHQVFRQIVPIWLINTPMELVAQSRMTLLVNQIYLIMSKSLTNKSRLYAGRVRHDILLLSVSSCNSLGRTTFVPDMKLEDHHLSSNVIQANFWAKTLSTMENRFRSISRIIVSTVFQGAFQNSKIILGTRVTQSFEKTLMNPPTSTYLGSHWDMILASKKVRYSMDWLRWSRFRLGSSGHFLTYAML